MYRYICILIILSLLSSYKAFAELPDPTRPPITILEGAPIVDSWTLDAVIISLDRRLAIINGETVKLGDEIQGYKLILIEPNSVQLQGKDDKMTLFLLDSSLKLNKRQD